MKSFYLNEKYRNTYTVTCGDMDPDYRLKPTTMLVYFQDTVASFLTTKYLAAFDVLPQGVIWVISEYSVKFDERPALWREQVVTEISPTEVTPLRAYFDFTLYRSGNVPFASGTAVWSIVDIATGRPVPMTDYYSITTDPALGETPLKHPKHVIPVPAKEIGESSQQTTISDMDFNRHVDNRAYLEIALHSVPAEFVASRMLKSLMVKFIRQTFIGDVLSMKYYVMDGPEGSDPEYVVVMKNSSDEEVCRIRMAWTERGDAVPDITSLVNRI